jgi:alpha-ketoglutarate-dependent taurine dioxygenase
VQLSKLTKEGKDQLALLVAQRKVVAFRDQDFADLPLQEALDFGGYFGRHHIHPTSGSPEGFPELHSKLPALSSEPLSDNAANYLDSRPSIRRHQQRFRILPREPQFQRLLALGRFL